MPKYNKKDYVVKTKLPIKMYVNNAGSKQEALLWARKQLERLENINISTGFSFRFEIDYIEDDLEVEENSIPF